LNVWEGHGQIWIDHFDQIWIKHFDHVTLVKWSKNCVR
jgi:hypothetical protein